MNIREERTADAQGVRQVNLAAFETSAEADIVDTLRRDVAPIISLVADDDGVIVGHVLYSPVTLTGGPQLALMGLGPIAVLPSRQRQGVGSLLIHEGFQRCRHAGVAAVVVLGHPEYYPRFGFVPASRLSLRCEFDVPDNVFMARELYEGSLTSQSGMIRYHPIFGNH